MSRNYILAGRRSLKIGALYHWGGDDVCIPRESGSYECFFGERYFFDWGRYCHRSTPSLIHVESVGARLTKKEIRVFLQRKKKFVKNE